MEKFIILCNNKMKRNAARGMAIGGDVMKALDKVIPDNTAPNVVKALKSDFKEAVKAGEIEGLTAARGMAHGGKIRNCSLGGDIGYVLGNWVQRWLGFARGGVAMKQGHSVFK
jgi:hypothetical protein